MNVYDVLTSGVMECLNSTKYKSPHTRRFDICNRYNSAIAHVLERNNVNHYLDHVECALVRGCKGLITKSICDNLNDGELEIYITRCAFPVIDRMFHNLEC